MKRVGLLILIMLAELTAGVSAFAESIVQKVPPCPPVYGTWRTTHVTDKFGNAQPLPIPRKRQGLIMEARIDQDKAVLVWFGDKKKMMFKRWYKFHQWDGLFIGLNGEKEAIARTDFETSRDYPNDNCYVEMSFYTKQGFAGSLEQIVLMTKIK